ncbi:guanosine diphosphatase KNAG_0G00460 [Huiozyma naganishii CBS 8797]|uniref:Guanosine-diphosphatase n=1 Tax=Huiozyma naganishii (strain ATCC MYA-139 / BCRC 22969 / CBS 8797 / KCTC 17520 / NBRC 10181 / NCYC 3082 / Yp74L-3) TaxID=1071383 RepID=J7RNH6_HUIN7|nr:hypothetical protein KNAG_0G00460 [Kazachstania naganishii CBS 8797]CCK71103.1 hypothetical protein KNAG_0G00460 [Kazachstania naganishii CBS 8797]
MGSLFRNYRVIIGAVALVMLILLIRTSTTASGGASRPVSPSINRPETPTDVNVGGGGIVSALPIQDKPGFVSDSKTDNGRNPDVAAAVKTQLSDCKKDHQYVVMIDAGSTGSRVHVYEFDVCSQPPALIKETFEMLKPGLSSFDTDTQGAAKSLDPLLKIAMDTVPAKARSCTPVAVKATAGLRMLGEAKSDAILQAVRKSLENNYPFAVVEGDGVSIMSGDQEGVYAWITTNYLLGNIGSGSKLPTCAVFDLGGGSTQIVFEPTFPSKERLIDGEHKYELEFNGENYDLYQFSHLGYGLMQGRNKINSVLVQNALEHGAIQKNDLKNVHTLSSPCLPPNVTTPTEHVKLTDGSIYQVVFKGPKVPAGAQCRFLADKILNKDTKCQQPPCSFNGVHQPSLVRAFKESNDLYIFSYFYDRTRSLAMPLTFTLNELYDLSKMVCNGGEVWESVFSGFDGPLEELKNDPYFCQDLTFEFSLLHTGYDIPLNRELKTAQKIADNELGWCLGASLPLLEGKNWKCKLNKVN